MRTRNKLQIRTPDLRQAATFEQATFEQATDATVFATELAILAVQSDDCALGLLSVPQKLRQRECRESLREVNVLSTKESAILNYRATGLLS